MLEPGSGGWKEGVQALVAELLTSGYELRVSGARALSLEQLEQELTTAVAESGATVGVSIVRTNGHATAWLCRPSSCEKLEVESAEGELSRSRLALAVVERLRPIELPTPSPPPPAPPPPEAAEIRFPSRPATTANASPLRLWVGAGAVSSSGLSGPLPWLAASLGATLSAPWGLEGGVAGAPWAATAESRAGSLSVRAVQAVAFATFEPFPRRRFGLSLGLGGGTAHVSESASPAPGFDGFSRSATVGIVSARARLQYQRGPLYWGVTVDPGMLVPALKVEAGTETVLRFGRPWVAIQASLGLAL